MAAFNHIISWQKLQYDFGFYKTDFLTNLVGLKLLEEKDNVYIIIASLA